MYTPSKDLETIRNMDFSVKAYTNTKMQNNKRYGIENGSQLISLINKHDDQHYIVKSVKKQHKPKSNSVDLLSIHSFMSEDMSKNDISKTAIEAKNNDSNYNDGNKTPKTQSDKKTPRITRAPRISICDRTINETKNSQGNI